MIYEFLWNFMFLPFGIYFMSLLKGLQGKLTPTDIPWLPKNNYLAVRFINEIALAEESDSSWDGTPLSHFDMYIKAMEQSKANYQPIKFFLNCLQKRTSVSEALKQQEFTLVSKNLFQAPSAS